MSERDKGLPSNSAQRKATPVFSGVLKYFPDALCEVAALSCAGNDKHNPGQPLHWAKEKSQDEDDCVIRHMLNVAKGEVFDEESYPGKRIRHRAAVAWRALAGLQREIEAERAKQPYVNAEPEVFRDLCENCSCRMSQSRAEGKAGIVLCSECAPKINPPAHEPIPHLCGATSSTFIAPRKNACVLGAHHDGAHENHAGQKWPRG